MFIQIKDYEKVKCSAFWEKLKTYIALQCWPILFSVDVLTMTAHTPIFGGFCLVYFVFCTTWNFLSKYLVLHVLKIWRSPLLFRMYTNTFLKKDN